MANPIVQQISAELEALHKELGQFKSTVDYLNVAKIHVKEAVESVNYAEAYFNEQVEELKNTYTSFIKLTDSVTAVISKIDTVNFPERLESIEKTVKETITYLNETRKATLDELQKASEIITKADFDGRFKKLQGSIDLSVQSNEQLVSSIEKQQLGEKIVEFERLVSKRIHESYKEVTKNTEQIATQTAKSIHDLNLPIRIDKLDANITGILTAIQNVQSRIESVERNIVDKLKDATEKQSSSLISFQGKINLSIMAVQLEISTTAKKQKTNTYITWALILFCTVAIFFICKLFFTAKI